MSRFDEDIPEVFRRAMEEAGWRGDQGDRPPPPGDARPTNPWWTSRWLWLGLLIIILFASLNWIVTTYTEWLWFTELAYQDVWLTQWGARVATFLIFFVAAAAVLLLNWHLARRRALRPAGGVQVLNLPGVNWLVSGMALFLAFLLAQAAAARWSTFLRYLYRVPYGVEDPVFQRDISFYLFELPAYRFIHGWLMPLFLITLLGVGAIYVINNLPRLQGSQLELRALPQEMIGHSAILLALFLLLWAVGYWFDAYELLFSPQGVVFGAGYTDINAMLPVLRVQLALMVLVAATVAYLAVRLDLRPAAVALGLWLVATVGLAGLYPSLLQRYAVEPNELAREEPYIANNIDFTRRGYDLHDINTEGFLPGEELSEEDLEDNDLALRNIRLWDYRPLLQTYRQLQELRLYYRFNDVDIDRYDIEGESRQVMLAAREMDKSGLPSPTWVNQRLEYTHGYGVVMNPVDGITSEGRPIFYVQNLPPSSTVGINIERPELYYGELTDDVVYANSNLQEFSYPSGDDNVYVSYEGTGGVPIDNALRRVAFALRFAETNVILSDYIRPETRAMFHRRIQERVSQIAPFLVQDADPYIVVADGRLVWMLDTYTISGDFPYSQPYVRPATMGNDTTLANMNVPDGINYIRNSVKVTVDAYDGSVNFYVFDPEDPILQTYQRIFPGMFKSMSEMPESLLGHVRYPVDLFLIQAHQYLSYHMTDVQVFYNQEDLWQIPNEIFDDNTQPIEPYYITFPLPGQEDAEFLLIQPYVPSTRNNMIAWIAARSDPPNYGEVHAFELPRQELIFGPIQIEGRIDQEPDISEQFALWNQMGSRVIRGNLIVVPINQNFLYVEPVYLQSSTSALPELKRVIAVSGENVVMRETLPEALEALIEDAPAVDEIVLEPPVTEEEDGEVPEPQAEETPEEVAQEPTPAPAATSPPPTDIEGIIQSANQHFEAAQAAQRDGDWATYGRELEALQSDLEQLMELTGGQLP